MGSGIYIAMSGARAQTEALDATANNVANAATAGFRADRVAFDQVLSGIQSPDMAFTGATRRSADTSPGVLLQTGNPLDLALRGDGFFSVQTPVGVRYTRAGAFQLDAEGTLVTSAGYAVLSADGAPISVPDGTTQLSVGADGTVRADDVELAQLQLAAFEPRALAREGSNLFAASRAPLPADALPEVVSGAVEQSNVNVVRGMVSLVRVSRTYEALLRMIESYRHIDERTARDIGGPK